MARRFIEEHQRPHIQSHEVAKAVLGFYPFRSEETRSPSAETPDNIEVFYLYGWENREACSTFYEHQFLP
jgi:hypothetical protein